MKRMNTKKYILPGVVLMLAILAGLWVIRDKGPSEEAIQCLNTAKVMISHERTAHHEKLIEDMIRGTIYEKEEKKSVLNADEVASVKRLFEKQFDRVKKNELWLRSESKAIQRWLEEGRARLHKTPRTEEESEGYDEEAEKLAWKIHMEKDMIDLLD
jgi:hypothetical protein